MPKINLSQIRGLILDMDGVIWRGNEPIGNTKKIFNRINQLGLKVVLASNNSTKTVKQYLKKLQQFDVFLDEEQIISSAVVTACYLKKRFPNGGDVYIVGENGLVDSLSSQGFNFNDKGNILAVVVGLDQSVTYEKIKIASQLIRAGAIFIGTNPDPTYPAPDGIYPGVGAIIAAIEAASETKPLILGKPETKMFELCLERMELQPHETIIIGDRLETDIESGQRLGLHTALVLSGVTDRVNAEQWTPKIDWIAESLEVLLFHYF